MALRDVLAAFKEFFAAKPCSGCVAREYHIASLKEELRYYREHFDNEVRVHHDDMNDIIKHITGMNRAQTQPANESNLRSINRASHTIGARIARAEKIDREENEAVIAARKKEYESRIASLLVPSETVVEEQKEVLENTRS